MKTVAMCFSLVQIPRCKLHTLANSWWGSVCKLGRRRDGCSSFKVLSSSKDKLDGGYSRRWSKRTISTKTGGNNEKLGSKRSIKQEIIPETSSNSVTDKLETTKIRTSSKISIGHEILSETTKTRLNTFKLEMTESETNDYYSELAKFATLICFDIETTGFGAESSRIIEIAFQDLRGGQNSTFQTLVNPECIVPNEHVHGISTRMVNRSEVPRMKDLIPIVLQYVRSRQIPGGVAVLIAHNARTFDVPFLKKEFSRCSIEIPSDWLFVDTLPLARKVMKPTGSKKVSLQALRDRYDIPLVGSAHRALSDVHTLALVLQRLSFDLKMPVSDLLKDSFK